jgi:uncharacterized protein
MSRNRLIELVASGALLLTVAGSGGGYYAWQKQRAEATRTLLTTLRQAAEAATIAPFQPGAPSVLSYPSAHHKVEVLLRRGADPNVSEPDVQNDGERISALWYALVARDPSSARLLLDHGADLDGAGIRRSLGYIADRNDTELLKQLLRRGAQVDARDLDGRTALICAAASRAHEAARVLIAHGADPNAMDDFGMTARRFARLNKDRIMVRLLQQAGATR